MELTIPQTPPEQTEEPPLYVPTEAEKKRIDRVTERVNWRGRITSRWKISCKALICTVDFDTSCALQRAKLVGLCGLIGLKVFLLVP